MKKVILKAGMVSNPKQKGAMDGVIAIFKALNSLPNSPWDIHFSVFDDVSEVREKLDIVISVGPDNPELANQIAKKSKAKFLMGMKDPFYKSEKVTNSDYNDYKFICDTMGTMRGSDITKIRPDLVYIPPVPPFTFCKQDLETYSQDSILDLFKSDYLFSIGGADPYTQRDVTIKDADNLIRMANDFIMSKPGKVGFSTSGRTSESLIRYIYEKMPKNGQWALYDAKNNSLLIGNEIYHDCESFYKASLSTCSYVIQTDDSLSMMAEVTVPEVKTAIYQTLGTFNSDWTIFAKRRVQVANYVNKGCNVTVFDPYYISDPETMYGLLEEFHQAKTLEGVMETQIATKLNEHLLNNFAIVETIS